jgi:NADH-quinone oxidoreductase subunit L
MSVAAAVIGIVAAFRLYLQRPEAAAALQTRFRGLHALLLNKYWVDELYDAILVRPVVQASVALWRFWDQRIIDGVVNGVGYTVEAASALLRLVQTGFVGTYALWFTLGVLALLVHVLRSHP